MTDGNRRRRTRAGSPTHSPERTGDSPPPWVDDDTVADRSADFGTDLVNLGFIGAAIRRSKRVWAGLAVLGLLFGLAFSVTHPPSPEASTTLLLTVGPEGQPGTAILTDQAMAESRGVAALALHDLGSRQGPDALLSTYHADVITDRVLRITVSAPSSSDAVRRANAIASAFLAFRAAQLQRQQKLQFAALDRALARSEQRVKSLETRISGVAAQPTSDARQAQLTNLRGTRAQARSDLVALKATVESAKATSEETTAAMVGQSQVLDAASALPQPHLKSVILFGGAGLVLGLFVGLAIVVVRAVVSDRLRRRDDIALALGAPVKLSIPARPLSRWRRGRHGLAAMPSSDVERIVALLRGLLPAEPRHGALAVIPADDTAVAAVSVVSLAAALAREGARVVVADLCDGAPAAKLVGAAGPGVRPVGIDGTEIEVAVPGPDEIAPVGPSGPTPSLEQAQLAAALTADARPIEVLLTLMSLDPSLPADHLRSWASDAVVLVTAGRSSWTRIHAVAEMIRLAGTRLAAAILVGADKWDESLGVTTAPGYGAGSAAAAGGSDVRPTGARTASRFASR